MTEDDDGSGALGAYIRAQRQLADMSIRQLAGVAKVSNAYLSQLERGLHQPSIRILASIAEALSIPSEDLLVQAGVPHAYGVRSEGQQAEAGADTFVAGSAVFRGDDPSANIAALRAAAAAHTH